MRFAMLALWRCFPDRVVQLTQYLHAAAALTCFARWCLHRRHCLHGLARLSLG